MGTLDHRHKCCEIDTQLATLRNLILELLAVEARRMDVVRTTGPLDIEEGVRRTEPIMADYKRLMRRLEEAVYG
jgi:hypothetical protein